VGGGRCWGSARAGGTRRAEEGPSASLRGTRGWSRYAERSSPGRRAPWDPRGEDRDPRVRGHICGGKGGGRVITLGGQAGVGNWLEPEAGRRETGAVAFYSWDVCACCDGCVVVNVREFF
jgi:hypothetical protein